MTHVTRAIRFLSTVHGSTAALRTGEKNILESTIFSPAHFPKFLAFTCVVSGFTGFHYMNHLQNSSRNLHVSTEWMNNHILALHESRKLTLFSTILFCDYSDSLDLGRWAPCRETFG